MTWDPLLRPSRPDPNVVVPPKGLTLPRGMRYYWQPKQCPSVWHWSYPREPWCTMCGAGRPPGRWTRRKRRWYRALAELAYQGCEHVTTGPGSCLRAHSGKRHSMDTGWADAWCDPCIAFAALHPEAVKHD